jgi:hypothetical protein
MRYKHKKLLADFWLENYWNKDVGIGGLCGLCGNTGKIDTTKSAISPMGLNSGGVYFCICPNGRTFDAIHKKDKS